MAGKKEKITYFDYTEDYKNLIKPKIQELRQLCSDRKIPLFVSVGTKNTDEGTEYERTVLHWQNLSTLKEDPVKTAVLSYRNFDTQPPTYVRDAFEIISGWITQRSEGLEEEYLDIVLSNEDNSDEAEKLEQIFGERREPMLISKRKNEQDLQDIADLYGEID